MSVLTDSPTRTLVFETVAEAYTAVSVFVALTLLIFYGLECYLKIDTAQFLERHRAYQVPIAAILGALPGCGGAIMVMSQYSIGRTGFGAVVAVLTSTMGDAAFLLLAKQPLTGLSVIGLSIVVGVISGYLVEKLHDPQFMCVDDSRLSLNKPALYDFGKMSWPWLCVLVPGLGVGVLGAFQIDVDRLIGMSGFTTVIGVIGAALSIWLWFVNPNSGASYVNRLDEPTYNDVWNKTITDTCFVTVWVILAFLAFELTLHWSGWNLKAAFSGAGAMLPIIGVLIGLLPGCGPQVLTTGLYLQGVIPLSAQLGNSISNDGDALFPALAMAPRASIIATLYTTIPALIVAYSYFFFIEA
ncbi:MAG: putative manganese transporter [Pseudomonadota bacterium]